VRYDITNTTSAYAAIDNVADVDYETVRGFSAAERTIRFGIETSF
jgi:vitamin B12 transporter